MTQSSESIISALCTKSEENTGCEHWGGQGFKEPLAVYLDSAFASARLNSRGQSVLLKNLERLLANRLLMQRSVDTDPSIMERPIKQPIFIVGMPRTGSTMLHYLLSRDPDTRTLRYFEGQQPVAADSTTSRDARVKTAARQIKILNRLAPELARVHSVTADGPEECMTLLEHTFVESVFELRTHVPAYSKWLQANENDPEYYSEFHRMLQILGMDTEKRWVCKSPRHMMCLESLVHVFPDAKIIWTHRNPTEAIPSMCSLSRVIQQVSSDEVNSSALGQFWLNRIASGIEKARKFRSTDKPARYIDVQYEELLNTPQRVIRKIYDHCGLSYSSELEISTEQWLVQNPKNKHGKHPYSLEQYGLTSSQIDERLSFIPDSERHIYLAEGS